MKELLFDFVRVTEEAAKAAYPLIGKLNKNEADHLATNALRTNLNKLPINAKVVIGEGEKDQAPMLYIGEKLGTGTGPSIDIAVDPIEGTTLVGNGMGNAISVLAIAEESTLLHAPDMYMKKIAVGKEAVGHIDIEAPVSENVKKVSQAIGKRISEMVIAIQARERHQDMIHEIISVGGKVKLFHEGDVPYVLSTALESSEIDLFVGVGGAPEGVISAVGLKCLGGEMQAKLIPSSDKEYERCYSMGIFDPKTPLTMRELVASDNCAFLATGITDGILLKGVHMGSVIRTHSLAIVGNEKVPRYIKSEYV
ncbi:class II fructose-bisphosphatase [Terrihalobacillus insolitus]|uniref:class II fructose-bisphosphatase n=1 Tax=Terrihalobacillus insolitus TaxID=2950438 RepID=UPI00234129E6|nr:class II fructose-bisphosphatase [Terrihalobacillus insolitus]MDC3415148.1 class II fructose-bisphosphatase [Terrihalobacillus insolitus]